MKSLFKVFIFSFLLIFGFQRIIDNECICGGIGVSENDCVFSIHSESSDSGEHAKEHICVNCPCNYILISYSIFYLNKIYTQITISYIVSPLFTAVNFDYLLNLIRPPRIIFT